jgi:hypothetical protein
LKAGIDLISRRAQDELFHIYQRKTGIPHQRDGSIRGVLNMLIDLIGVGRAMLNTADWAVVSMNDDKSTVEQTVAWMTEHSF